MKDLIEVDLNPVSFNFQSGEFVFSRSEALDALEQLTKALFPTMKKVVPGELVVAYRDGGIYISSLTKGTRRVSFGKRPYSILEYIVLHDGVTAEALRRRFFKRDEFHKEATRADVYDVVKYLNRKLEEYGVFVGMDDSRRCYQIFPLV